MTPESLLFKSKEELINFPTNRLVNAVNEAKNAVSALLMNDNKTDNLWKEINEVNEWAKQVLAPLLREIIKEENSQK